MRPSPDWTLYLVTDRSLCRGRDLTEVVAAAVRGGVTAVQLREKDLGGRELVRLGRAVLAILRPTGVSLLVDDRPDVALAIGAQGVHLGQADIHPGDARRILGPDALIGLSVETEEQAAEAADLDVDYLGVSPIHATPTKTDTGTPWGVPGLRRLRGLTRRPLVAIGGLGARNAAETVAAGADGIAVVSAICGAEDPEGAAAAIIAEIRRARSASRGR